MELQRIKLENVKNRLLNGEKVKSTRVENGGYFVELTNGPEIAFEDDWKPTVDRTIEKAEKGVRENTVGGGTTLNQVRSRPD